MNSSNLLYISYNELNEPVSKSQVVPYIGEFVNNGFNVSLLTYEKNFNKEHIEDQKHEISSKRIDWHVLRYHKTPSLLATAYDVIQGVFLSYRLIKKNNIQIVHARSIVSATICALLSKVLKFKWVYDMRGLVAEEFVGHGSWRQNSIKYKVVKIMEKQCLLSADSITVLTHRQKEFVLDLDFMKGVPMPIDVIPCCADLDIFKAKSFDGNLLRDTLEPYLDKFVLVYVGSFGTCYLLPEMLDFFLSLKKKVANAHFLFLTHSNPDLVIDTAIEKGLDDSSFTVMPSEYDKIPEWLSVCDAGIYFINSYMKLGSCPIKFAEYLSCGLPVVLNPGIGDTDTIVNTNNIGVVVKGFDQEEYDCSVDKLLTLVNNDSELNSRCCSVANDEFSLIKGSQKYMSIYNSLGLNPDANVKMAHLYKNQ